MKQPYQQMVGLRPSERPLDWNDERRNQERQRRSVQRMVRRRGPRLFLYPLFEHMSREHGLTLLDSELEAIRDVCRKLEHVAPPNAEVSEQPPKTL